MGFNAINTLWILIAAILVFFMQAGFGMVEAGLVRTKNAANIIMTVSYTHLTLPTKRIV